MKRQPCTIPLVMQYNKRDLPGVLSVAELDALLPRSVACPRIEAVATTGVGVFDALKAVTAAIVARLRDEPGEAAPGASV